MEALIEKVRLIVRQVTDQTEFKLIELDVKKASNRVIVRVFLDSEKGITIDECRQMAKAMKGLLEEDHFANTDYLLEVSSPGVERPLTEEWQFRKNIGRKLALEYTDANNHAAEVVGRLMKFEDRILFLEPAGKKSKHKAEEFTLPMEKITRARVQLDW